MDTQNRKRPDYGIDAPGVVRNLLLVAGASGIILATRIFGLWTDEFSLAPLLYACIWPGAGCLLMALWMLWDSKIGKIRDREKFLDRIPWRGDETVLDVGCGRGLFLIGAAKRLTTGKAVGIDIWQSEDLSGNRPEATLENARVEGAADRVEVQDGDARQLPFADGTFDVVLASNSLHNIYDAKERRQALQEIARVLKPGGRVGIDDMRHTGQYAQVLKESGLSDVRRTGNRVLALVLTIVTFGSMQPYQVWGRKPGSAGMNQ